MMRNKVMTFILMGSMCVLGLRAAEAEIDLRLYEKRRIAQHGEDGVLEKIFELIGTMNKYYVEFGAGDGHFCSNVKWLKEKYGWTGLLMDGACSNKMADDLAINLHKEFITAENICGLFKKYGVPEEFDLISIDIDSTDFYVWRALNKLYRPRVVVIEFNSLFNAEEDYVIRYSADASWVDGHYFGASILAFFNLGRSMGYSLVYGESNGVNLFFVRDDVLAESKAVFKNVNDVTKLHRPCQVPVFVDPRIVARKFISSKQALNNKE